MRRVPSREQILDALKLAIQQLPAPTHRTFADRIVTVDLPEGSRRAFNRIARDVPGSRKCAWGWAIPYAFWREARGRTDPPAICAACGGWVRERPTSSAEEPQWWCQEKRKARPHHETEPSQHDTR